MSEQSFLAHLITEDLYLLKEEVKTEPQTEELPAIEPSKAEESEPICLSPLPTEGRNLKHCLVLVESENPMPGNDLKGLLEKIMAAVKRSMNDILLVNVKAASDDQLEALLSEQNHRHLLAFGTQKVRQLAEAEKYELRIIDGKSYLKADSLKAISENMELKKALWKVLKEMF